MCGIAAVFAYGESAPSVDRDEVIAMRDYMASRGPDGAGEWFSQDGRVGLGHRRLAIIDLSPTGAQPMFSADGSLAIVFNGEIYNYRELRAKLERGGQKFVSQSDTEVLLHLYEGFGEAMLDEVRGMYAFAIWDNRRRGLFLARDPYGIKPLYYSDDGNTVRVASQVKALLAGGRIDISPDPAGHVGYFLWGHIPEPYTLYRKIRAVPAGCTMSIDEDGPRAPRRFCDISAILAEAESEIRNSTADLRSALGDSVRHHLVADVPVGVFLSAGLDSTTITALATEEGGTLRTVTLGFEEYKGTSRDETQLAEKAARHYSTAHQTIWVTRDDFQTERDHLFASMDQPTHDGVNTFFVSLAAKRAGLKVAMSGLGGDELFGGYPSFEDIPRAVTIFGFAQRFPALGQACRVISHRLIAKHTSPKYAGLLEYCGTYPGAYLLRRGMFMPWELPELLEPDVVREGWRELQPLLRLEETIDGLRKPRLKVSALESCWYMRNQLLRDSDWAGMAHSVEIRVPFVDVDVLRRLAPILAKEDWPTKRDVVESVSSNLPAAILDRPKTGFSIPVREWLMQEIRNPESAIHNTRWNDRGLRGWVKEVYSHFVTRPDLMRLSCSPGLRPSHRRSTSSPREILMLVSDAFGGCGGIAKFNRDFIAALSTSPTVERIIAVPRVASGETSTIPEKLNYVSRALGGKLKYMQALIQEAKKIRHRSAARSGVLPIIICGHINLLPAALLARWICGGPVYLIVHGIDAWKPSSNPITNACVRKIDDFISVSAVTRRRFLRWSGLRQDQGIVLPNCVDLSRFAPGPKPEQMVDRYQLQNRTVLLTVGRLASEERYKGFDEILQLLPRLSRDIPNIAYLIVGDGLDRARLEQKAKQIGVRDRVIFAGRIPENEKADHYRLADVYVMPGSGEGFGLVYLEALACGLPVVGSKVDGSRDALRNGKLGILVDPSNPDEIVTAILQSLGKKKIFKTNDAIASNERVEYFSRSRFEHRVRRIIESAAGT